jgi:hypothetical protein
MDTLEKQRRNIERAMEYAAPPARMDEAADLCLRFRNDRVALDLLLEFYSFLPEAREDYVRDIRLVARAGGVFLLAAITGESGYLYLVSSEGIEFHGSLAEGYLDRDLLEFFGFATPEMFKKLCLAPENLPPYEPLQVDREICPACHAVSGELHELGCPVEVCPWCGGQLIHCSCRFDKLGTEVIGEKDLARLEALLNEKGRITYSPDQRPDFVDEGPGVHFEED